MYYLMCLWLYPYVLPMHLSKAVNKLGGFNRVLNQNQLKVVAHKMNLSSLGSQGPTLIKAAYKK